MVRQITHHLSTATIDEASQLAPWLAHLVLPYEHGLGRVSELPLVRRGHVVPFAPGTRLLQIDISGRLCRLGIGGFYRTAYLVLDA